MKKFKSLITEFGQESGAVDYRDGSFIGEHLVRIGIEDVEFSSEKRLDSGEFLGKEVTIVIGESEPEVPVIPKHVADWITKHREKFDLYPALKELEESVWGWERTYKWYRMNTHKFVNAYLMGEYEVEEEPLYYALVKGHELMVDDDTLTFKYWNFDTFNGDLFPSNRFSRDGRFLIEMSKSEWNKIGINSSNADFVKVNE